MMADAYLISTDANGVLSKKWMACTIFKAKRSLVSPINDMDGGGYNLQNQDIENYG